MLTRNPNVPIDGSGISRTLWPAHVKPQEDELLSSWLVRLAMAHGVKLHTFCSTVWPGKQIWTRDIDKCADDAILNVLSQRTAVDKNAVIKTTLAAYAGYLYERHNPYGNTFWIMPLGIYHRKHQQYGLQFCPRCLTEDKRPYYRRRWRLAFVTCCESHSIKLLDRCYRCHVPINFHRDEMGTRARYSPTSMFRCYQCRIDLRKSILDPSDPIIKGFQVKLMEAISQGWIEIRGYGPVHSHLYFSVLHQLMRLLAMGKRAKVFRDAISRGHRIENPTLTLSKEHRGIEYLNVAARTTLVNMARCLLEEWPDRFIEICSENKIWSSTLLRDFDSPPFWFWSVIHDHLFRASYCPSDQEIISTIAYLTKTGKPISRKAISRHLGASDAFRKRKSQIALPVSDRKD